MDALALKRDILKPEWAGSFHILIHTAENWYHCHDNEEVPAGSEISLKSRIGLPISGCPPTSFPHFIPVN